MAELDNPYQPPASRVADLPPPGAVDGTYVEGGRTVDASHGWTWIRDGFGYFRSQVGIWILLGIIFFAILIGAQIVPFIGALALPLLMPVLVGGFMAGCQAIERGGELELAHLFAGFRRNTGKLVLVGVIGMVLSTLAALPVMIVGFGSGVFAMMSGTPGAALAFGAGTLLAGLVSLALAIPVNMALWFAPALVMLRDHSAPHALAESFRGTLRNFIPFLIFGAIVFVIAFPATLLLGLGWLVLGPVVIASVYAAYRDIYFEN